MASIVAHNRLEINGFKGYSILHELKDLKQLSQVHIRVSHVDVTLDERLSPPFLHVIPFHSLFKVEI